MQQCHRAHVAIQRQKQHTHVYILISSYMSNIATAFILYQYPATHDSSFLEQEYVYLILIVDYAVYVFIDYMFANAITFSKMC